jgi:hypothetical protein
MLVELLEYKTIFPDRWLTFLLSTPGQAVPQ